MSDGAADRPIATPSQTVGPFFQVWLRHHQALGVLASPDTPGQRVRLRLVILDGDGAPVPDCLVEIYQANADGEYGQPSFTGFGRLPTDSAGACVFDTIRPGRVSDADGTAQAAHVNVCLFARGLLRHLYTRVYFAGDPLLETDPLLGLVPADRRRTLIACRREGSEGSFECVIRLQGEGETVFFDL